MSSSKPLPQYASIPVKLVKEGQTILTGGGRKLTRRHKHCVAARPELIRFEDEQGEEDYMHVRAQVLVVR